MLVLICSEEPQRVCTTFRALAHSDAFVMGTVFVCIGLCVMSRYTVVLLPSHAHTN